MARTPTPPPATPRGRQVDPRHVTHETIADHLQAFQAAGGRIEVLGTTRVLKNVDPAPVDAPRAKDACEPSS